MSTLWQDVRYAFRSLAKSPGFTAVTLLTLALGIGANSAIFSVVNGVLIRPLPYPEPDRLAVVRETYGGGEVGSVSGANFLDWKTRTHRFESLAAWRGVAVSLLGAGEPEEMPAALVSADFFRTLGVAPMLGRGLLPGEDQGQGTVAVIGETLWRTRFGADSGILGRTLNLSGMPYTIVGVAPASLAYPGRTQLWLPLGFGVGRANERDSHSYDVVGRLKPGASLSDAQADVSAVARALTAEYPATNTGRGATVIAFTDDAVDAVRPALWLLLGAVAFVLLIACANVANLSLARASTRAREVAIRAALGAGRGRLIQQALVEAVVLAVVGGVLGLLVASWSVDALLALHPRGIPRLNDISIDGQVLGFTLAVSLVVGLAFGLVPALAVTRHDPADSFRGEGRGTSGGRSASRFRAGLVVAQIALALVLLAGAALLIVSVRRLAGVNPGFRPAGAAAFQFNVPSAKYQSADAQRGFVTRVLDRLRAIPGASHAGAVYFLPLGDGNTNGDVSVEGEPPAAPGHERFAGYRIVMGEYLESMGISLRRGRPLRESDAAGAQLVAVVNEAFARSFFGGRDPLGQRVTFGSATDEPEWREIVGVVGDVHHEGLSASARPEIYVPAPQLTAEFWTIFTSLPISFVVRSALPPETLFPAIKAAVHDVDPEQPVSRLRPISELVTDAVARYRFSMLLLTAFGGLALCLAAVGVYGVMAYSVSQRTRELGIRLALGARAGSVRHLVLRRGLGMAAIGIGLGLVGALALTRLLASQLFGVSPTDPVIIAIAVATLAAVSTVACLVPAVRATKVDPLVALRSE
ncbi:MAG TPA: ABC transporter permease [Gemmatimonadales bacterium]|nr:ABC transporter permease [Gemmatimonadales bacterium]